MAAPAQPAPVPANLAQCICLANKLPCDLCCGDLCFLDAGIHVVFRPKKNEAAVAVALDGCVFTDNRKKCDGMFVLFRSHQIDVLLVELKGSHLEDAYEQIAYVVNSRQEYADAVSHLASLAQINRRVRESSVIVSTRKIDKRDREKLEKRGASDLKLSLRKSRLALLLIFANIFDAIMISLICRDSLLSCSQPTQSKPYFDDRIEIENPGVLILGLSLDDLPRWISRLRNRVSSRVFRELGLIEQWGSGIPVILEEAASQHLPPPLFEEVGLRFRVTLPLAQASPPPQGQSRPRGADSLAEGELAEIVLQALADGPLSKSEIAHALGRESVSGALNRTIRRWIQFVRLPICFS